MGDDQDQVIGLPRTKPSLRTLLDQQSGMAIGGQPSLAQDALPRLPQPEDDYAAHARPSTQLQSALRFLLRDGSRRGFPYANLESFDLLPHESPGGGLVLLLLFVGSGLTEVRIEGRNLDALWDYIGHHRIAWVREAPTGRDFGEQANTVVTRILIRGVE